MSNDKYINRWYTHHNVSMIKFFGVHKYTGLDSKQNDGGEDGGRRKTNSGKEGMKRLNINKIQILKSHG